MTFDADYCFSLRWRMGRDMCNRYSTSRKGTKWYTKQLRKGRKSDLLGNVLIRSLELAKNVCLCLLSLFARLLSWIPGFSYFFPEWLLSYSSKLIDTTAEKIVSNIKNVRFPYYVYSCLLAFTIYILHNRSIGFLYS